jgi:hypothetical protein
MYHSWQHLIIQNENGLQDPGRIRKLSRSDGRVGWMSIVSFVLAGLISVLVAILLFYQALESQEKQMSFILSGIAMIVLAGAFGVGAWLFQKEISTNLLRGFLKTPDEFIFVQGQLEDCHYHAGEKRRHDRIIVEGSATGPFGERLLIYEEFSPEIWNFTTPEAEKDLQKSSDWYDKKGLRRLLPVPAYFICKKHRPSTATLVAINQEYISIVHK